jgi:proliferating cell nuclear antigen
MDIEFRDGGLLKRIVAAIKDQLSDVIVHVRPDGELICEEMDNSHVSLVALRLTRGAFARFDGLGQATYTLGLHLDALIHVLKVTCKAAEGLVWKMNSPQADHLNVAPSAQCNAKRPKGTDLRLINIEREHLTIPSNRYPFELLMNSVDLSNLIKDLALFGDEVTVVATPTWVQFSASGDFGEHRVRLNATNPADVTTCNAHALARLAPPSKSDGDVFIFWDAEAFGDGDRAKEITRKYSLKYLSKFSKGATVSDHVRVAIAPELPLMMNFPIYGDPPEAAAKKSKARSLATKAAAAEDDVDLEGVVTTPAKEEKGAKQTKLTTTADEKKAAGTKRKEAPSGPRPEATGAKRQKVSDEAQDEEKENDETTPVCGDLTFYLAPKDE